MRTLRFWLFLIVTISLYVTIAESYNVFYSQPYSLYGGYGSLNKKSSIDEDEDDEPIYGKWPDLYAQSYGKRSGRDIENLVADAPWPYPMSRIRRQCRVTCCPRRVRCRGGTGFFNYQFPIA